MSGRHEGRHVTNHETMSLTINILDLSQNEQTSRNIYSINNQYDS